MSIDNLAVLCATISQVIEESVSPVLDTVKQEAHEMLVQLQSGIQPPQANIDRLIQFALNHTQVLTGHERSHRI